MRPSLAGILSTGTEILQGLYADTNAQWLSDRLTGMGLSSIRHVAAPDDADSVADALGHLIDRCDCVIMTGGLGPTEDDLTRQAVGRLFGTDLVEDARAWTMIEERFALRGSRPPESNRVQCFVPRGARVLHNHWGTAPGFLMERAHRNDRSVWFAALPGPPRENRPMFDTYLRRRIAERFGRGRFVRIKTLHTVGVSESALNGILLPVFRKVKADPDCDMAFLAGEARVDVRLTVRGRTRDEMTRKLRSIEAKILRRLPEGVLYGRDAETLESVVQKLLRERGLCLATAESCTGGLIAKRLTDVPGSSDVFREGWVVYSNEAKKRRLGVSAPSLRRHGAVSAEVARQMALGALQRSGADLAVAVTGIAGPTGGTEEKPVGLVWYGLAWRESLKKRGGSQIRVEAFRTCFTTVRELVRIFASHRALDLVRRRLLDLPLELPKT